MQNLGNKDKSDRANIFQYFKKLSKVSSVKKYWKCHHVQKLLAVNIIAYKRDEQTDGQKFIVDLESACDSESNGDFSLLDNIKIPYYYFSHTFFHKIYSTVKSSEKIVLQTSFFYQIMHIWISPI